MTCTRLTGYKFASREGLRVAVRARAYLPAFHTDVYDRDKSRAGMARVQQGGLARMFRHSVPI